MANLALIGQIMEWEDGAMEHSEMVVFFQNLVDTGLVWKLQGSYGRTARDLISQGLVTERTEDDGAGEV